MKNFIFNNKSSTIQEFNILNTLNFVFLSKNNFYELLKKIFIRFFDYKSFLYKNENLLLLQKKSKSLISFIKKKNYKIAIESIRVCDKIEKRGNDIIKIIPYDLGGSGKSVLLYFLTRIYKPSIILETGVAAGFSSYAFLVAIKKNNKGLLYSSDLPYFRIKNPKKFIGIVVPKKLKKKWRLYIEGDETNIFKIKKKLKKEKVDLIHYDSDKSFIGRKYFFDNAQSLIKKNTVIIMDDLHNNIFFFDYIKKNNIKNFHILKYKSAYVGVILPTK